jgi:signal peptidase II
VADAHPLPADRAVADGSTSGVDGPFLVRVGILVAAITLVLDQATKELAEAQLLRGRLLPVLGDGWGWQLTYNDGGAFGFPAPSWFFLVVTAVVTVIVIRNLPRVQRVTGAVAYGLLLAGALGNVFDRVVGKGPGSPGLLQGEVVDFIAVRLPLYGDFPRFNVADIAITCGFALLILTMFLEERAAERDAGS